MTVNQSRQASMRTVFHGFLVACTNTQLSLLLVYQCTLYFVWCFGMGSYIFEVSLPICIATFNVLWSLTD